MITLDMSAEGSSQQDWRGATRLCPEDVGLQATGGKCRDLISLSFSFFDQLLSPGLRLEAGYRDEHEPFNSERLTDVRGKSHSPLSHSPGESNHREHDASIGRSIRKTEGGLPWWRSA